jgi:23S rRNA (cytosine1962-C5)-methyltransferase
MRHLAKWGRRQGISCFRLYERDIPDYPAIIDWYADEGATDIAREGDAVVWIFERTKDETPEARDAHERDLAAQVLEGLAIDRDRVHFKHRGRQRRDEGGRAQYERASDAGLTRTVQECDLRYEVNLSDYLDVGLFLDHRPLRRMVRARCAGKRVLNLFAYTGAFSVCARAGGAAATTTVDMSGPYLDWYRRNLRLNGFDVDECHHRALQADCLQWLDQHPAEPDRFDIVILDPPTFSNSKRMDADSFSIERDAGGLLRDAARFVSPGGELFFSTNARRFSLEPSAVPEGFGCREITNRTVPDDFRNKSIHRCWRLAEGWGERS